MPADREGDASPIARARTLFPAYLCYALQRSGVKRKTPGQSVSALPGVIFLYLTVTYGFRVTPPLTTLSHPENGL